MFLYFFFWGGPLKTWAARKKIRKRNAYTRISDGAKEMARWSTFSMQIYTHFLCRHSF